VSPVSDAPYWQTVPPPPTTRPQDVAALVLAGIANVALSVAVVRLIGSAWTECADIEAGGRFILVFGYLPVTALATACTAAITLHSSRRLGRISRAVLVLAAVLLAALLVVMWSVPVAGYGDWPGGAGDEATAQCGPGGVPTWWPSWLPS
jgi:hypothetical protein